MTSPLPDAITMPMSPLFIALAPAVTPPCCRLAMSPRPIRQHAIDEFYRAMPLIFASHTVSRLMLPLPPFAAPRR